MTNRDDRGLRASVPAACRAALRDPAASEQHLTACSFCAARVRAAAKLGAWLTSDLPVAGAAVPREVGQPEVLLQRIRERIVESAESGPVGEWLEQAPVAVPSDAEQPHWHDALAADAVAADGADLAGSLLRAPVQPAEVVWSQVRRSILDDVVAATSAGAGARTMGWRVLLAGAAASAVIGLIAVSEGSFLNGTQEPPAIVFTELERAPNVEFAVVRYGARR